MCGTTSPTQPMIPETATLADVARVAAAMTIARTVAPIEIPPGILTAVIGTPVFIALLARSPRLF
jgi:iron complex transport system permease protein